MSVPRSNFSSASGSWQWFEISVSVGFSPLRNPGESVPLPSLFPPSPSSLAVRPISGYHDAEVSKLWIALPFYSNRKND